MVIFALIAAGIAIAECADLCSYASLHDVMIDNRGAVKGCTGSCSPSGEAGCAAKCYQDGGLQSNCAECMGDAFHCIYKVSPASGTMGKCAAVCSTQTQSGLDKKCEHCLMAECNPHFEKCGGVPLPIDYFFSFANVCTADAINATMRNNSGAVQDCLSSCEPAGNAECAAKCFNKGGLQRDCGECMGNAFHCIYEISPASGTTGECAAVCSTGTRLDKKCEDCLMGGCNPSFFKCSGLTFPINDFFQFNGTLTQPVLQPVLLV